jgi:hypothetical protein
MLISGGIVLLMIYLPPVNAIFDAVALAPPLLGIAAGFSLIAFVGDEISKLIHSAATQ